MLLGQIIEKTGWQVCTCENENKLKSIEINDGYCSDLLSDVIANAPNNSLWITIQTHENIVAVSLLKDLKAILVSNNKKIPLETKKRAEDEGIVLLQARENSYKCAGMLFKILEALHGDS